MDGVEGDELSVHHLDSASAASRAVSTKAFGARHDPSVSPVRATAWRGRLASRPSSRASFVGRFGGSSGGIDSQTIDGEGIGSLGGLTGPAGGIEGMTLEDHAGTASSRFGDGDGEVYPWPDQDACSPDTSFATPRHFSRPPLPPPLTPPRFDSMSYPFEDRRRSYAVSIPPELDTSFIHQPNPEYFATSTSTDAHGSSSPQSSPMDAAIPRRRSYTKSVPIGIPMPSTTSASSTETTISGGGNASSSTFSFSPSSYPPTSPLLPPPPPPEYQFVGGPGGPGVLLSQEEIDLHGEIISVVDGAGHGWKRHTRVYGGGVCLACLAADGEGGDGGFYGDKVPLEDRR
ncbi:hypothetical protein N656DRAFT_767713 [Canariomyces notabilis]|uniref:Uncharacterized protein n=1 Tax=Canariomyces notabilis TaxID=2074819 RepID=A0AAN6TGC9_9PEZI|nr:hypothetical protein N656DRAFT_767713 [Canariomyces arenarius]